MKIFVINLARATERWQHMQKMADLLKLEFHRIDAVDGSKMTTDFANQIRPQAGKTHLLSHTEIACFLSHRLAWTEIAKGDDDFGVVLEDDLQISNDAKQLLPKTDWIPSGCDFIKIETVNRALLLSPPFTQVLSNRKIWKIAGPTTGCGGYVLSKKAAAALLEITKTFCEPVDHFIFDPTFFSHHQLVTHQLDPAICVQQVRSKTVFMAAKAGASQMDNHRGVIKKSGLEKIRTEVLRPFKQLSSLLMFKVRAAIQNGKYGKVEFL